MAPTASAQSAAIVSLTARSMIGNRAFRSAQNVVRRDPNVGEDDLRGPLAVLGRIAAPGHAGSVAVDEEEANSLAIAARALKARRDDELIGAVALADERLFSPQHEAAAAVLNRAQSHIVEIEARLFFRMREAQAQFAGGDGADELGAPLGACAVLQKSAAEDDRLKIGLKRERLAEFLHHDHRLDGAAAEAPVRFGKGRAEQAHFGVIAPQSLAPALRSELDRPCGPRTRSAPSSAARHCRAAVPVRR